MKLSVFIGLFKHNQNFNTFTSRLNKTFVNAASRDLNETEIEQLMFLAVEFDRYKFGPVIRESLHKLSPSRNDVDYIGKRYTSIYEDNWKYFNAANEYEKKYLKSLTTVKQCRDAHTEVKNIDQNNFNLPSKKRDILYALDERIRFLEKKNKFDPERNYQYPADAVSPPFTWCIKGAQTQIATLQVSLRQGFTILELFNWITAQLPERINLANSQKLREVFIELNLDDAEVPDAARIAEIIQKIVEKTCAVGSTSGDRRTEEEVHRVSELKDEFNVLAVKLGNQIASPVMSALVIGFNRGNDQIALKKAAIEWRLLRGLGKLQEQLTAIHNTKKKPWRVMAVEDFLSSQSPTEHALVTDMFNTLQKTATFSVGYDRLKTADGSNSARGILGYVVNVEVTDDAHYQEIIVSIEAFRKKMRHSWGRDILNRLENDPALTIGPSAGTSAVVKFFDQFGHQDVEMLQDNNYAHTHNPPLHSSPSSSSNEVIPFRGNSVSSTSVSYAQTMLSNKPKTSLFKFLNLIRLAWQGAGNPPIKDVDSLMEHIHQILTDMNDDQDVVNAIQRIPNLQIYLNRLYNRNIVSDGYSLSTGELTYAGNQLKEFIEKCKPGNMLSNQNISTVSSSSSSKTLILSSTSPSVAEHKISPKERLCTYLKEIIAVLGSNDNEVNSAEIKIEKFKEIHKKIIADTEVANLAHGMKGLRQLLEYSLAIKEIVDRGYSVGGEVTPVGRKLDEFIGLLRQSNAPGHRG